MNLSMMICSTVLVGLAALVCNAAQAQAPETEQRVVMYGDLNLDHPAAVETLYSRIRGASRSVCIATIGRNPLQATARRDCTREVLADAISELNDERLTAYYTDRMGGGVQKIASR